MEKEIVQGDKNVLIKLVVFIICLLGISFCIDPTIDYLIGYNDVLIDKNIDKAGDLISIKLKIQAYVYAVLYFVPVVFFSWLAAKTINDRVFPPYNVAVPFSIKRAIGMRAYQYAIYCILLALYLVFKATFGIYESYVINSYILDIFKMTEGIGQSL